MLCNINMDKFVTKSSSTCNSTGSKSKSNNYGKDCEITMKKKWQMKWLEEFSWMPIHTERGVMKCKLCCKWPNMVLLSFFPELGLATWFCKGSVTIINFDHCELIGISSSFCWASNCTCQLISFVKHIHRTLIVNFFSIFQTFLLLPYLVWSRNFLILIKYCNVRRKNHYHAIKR